MFDVGGGELIFILFIVLLLFGPKKIPELAQMVGKGMQHLKKAQSQLQSQINDIQSEIKTVTEAENTVKTNPPFRSIESPGNSDVPQVSEPLTNDTDDTYQTSSDNFPMSEESAPTFVDPYNLEEKKDQIT